MASEKKPTMYSDRGKVGSVEELETYGVWVKSEPQDFTATLAEAANFNADALPYDADFDTGFDDMGTSSGFDLFDQDLNIPEMSVEDDIMTDADRGSEEASTQLLMKIAGELSSIRSELNTLKQEFAEIRGDSPAEGEPEAKSDDFFSGAEDDNEKIALAGDEMENLFASADFPSEEEMGFDPTREADEAALKELSDKNGENEEEEIHIDFDNLGIDLGIDTDTAEPEELPPLEAADDDGFEIPSFDTLSFDEEEGAEGFAEELVPLEEDEELRELRLEGAQSLATPPENADYLEEDPFVNAGFEVNAAEEVAKEPVLEDDQPEAAAAEDTVSFETAASESADLGLDDLTFDETSFDIGLDDFSTEEPAADDKPLADDTSLDLSEAVIDEPDLSAQIVEPPLEEPVLSDISFDDDISIDMDDFGTEIEIEDDTKADEPAAEDTGTDFEIEKADDFGLVDLQADIESPPELEPLEPLEPVVAEPKTVSKAPSHADIISDVDDSVIPEGFEVNAKEADISLDDDLEAFTEDESSIDTGALTVEDSGEFDAIPAGLKSELKNVLSYMDHLLESLPEDKIEEFAQSEYFEKYKKIFKELGLV